MAAGTHRVVVVGGGFGGLQTVRHLTAAPVAVTLVDRHNYHLFQPLLYQVATGALAAPEIAVPLRSVLRRQANARVMLGDVVEIDLQAREVVLRELPNGEAEQRLAYDTLVVAGGSRYSYFGHDEWEEHAPQLKSLDGALDIRSRILGAFEAAEVEHDEERRRAWLTFVVVGAGPTGVEMAGQIAELARDALRREFRSVDTAAARVLLVESADRVLPGSAPRLSQSALRVLTGLGVTPLLGHTVVDIAGDSVGIREPGGEVQPVSARTVIWAAGVAASELATVLATAAGVECDRAGRIPVRPDLTVPGHPEVFAVGDMIRVERSEPFPGLAPVAIQQGRYVAGAIRGRLEGRPATAFRYVDKGTLATIGRSHAVADIKGLRLTGFPAWAAWLAVHIVYLIGFQNRLLVMLRWTFSFVTHGRGARLISHRASAGDYASRGPSG
jgi:NADH dehydrogenase